MSFGIKLSNLTLSIVNASRPTQLGRQLMGILITRDEMMTSSVTGRSSSSYTVAKPPLDPSKVAALLGENAISTLYKPIKVLIFF